MQQGLGVLVGDLDGVGVDERGDAAMDVDVMAVEVGPDPLAERLADDTAAVHERVHGDRSVVAEPDAVQVAAAKAREVERGLPHRLARNSGIGHRAPETRCALDQRHLLAEVGGLRGALLAAGSRADHDEIVGRSLPSPAILVQSAHRGAAAIA